MEEGITCRSLCALAGMAMRDVIVVGNVVVTFVVDVIWCNRVVLRS
jgi:hypothetical protein